MWGLNHEYTSLRVAIGKFYERIAYALYGGNIKEKQIIDTFVCEPDLTNNRKILECKAVRPKNHVKLYTRQLFTYASWQVKGTDTISNPIISFLISRYGIKNITNYCKEKTKEEIIRDLAKHTWYSLELPFSIIYQIYKNAKISEWASFLRDTDERRNRVLEFACFNAGDINNFITNPRETFQKFGLDPNNYKCKIFLVDNLKLNGIQMSPFPIKIISDKDHDSWLERFIREEYKNIESKNNGLKEEEDFLRKKYGTKPEETPKGETLESDSDVALELEPPTKSEDTYDDEVPF